MNDIECPYCGQGLEINHDDGQGYEEDTSHEQECYHCGKTFLFTTSISFSYESNKADCLNGGEHKYETTMTVPRKRTKYRCSDCDHEKPLTDSEMKAFLISIEVNKSE